MGYGGVKQDTRLLSQWDGNAVEIKLKQLLDSHLTRTLNLLYILFSS